MSLDGILTWLEHGHTDYVRSALINLPESDRKVLGPKGPRLADSRQSNASVVDPRGWRPKAT